MSPVSGSGRGNAWVWLCLGCDGCFRCGRSMKRVCWVFFFFCLFVHRKSSKYLDICTTMTTPTSLIWDDCVNLTLQQLITSTADCIFYMWKLNSLMYETEQWIVRSKTDSSEMELKQWRWITLYIVLWIPFACECSLNRAWELQTLLLTMKATT